MKYTVVFEQGPTSWGAHVPDLPGCIAVDETLDGVRRLIGEAIEEHIETLRSLGRMVPQPVNHAEVVETQPA